MEKPPTFDEWHLAKHGLVWDQKVFSYMVSDALQDLSQQLREYTTEMVEAAVNKIQGSHNPHE